MELALKMPRALGGRLFPLPVGTSLRVGRVADADVQVPDICLSRYHSAVWRDETGVWVRDLNSVSGTRIWRNPGGPPDVIGKGVARLLPCNEIGADHRVRLVFHSPVAFPWLDCNEGTIRKVAQWIRWMNPQDNSSRAAEAFCLLHDALLDAGCDDADVLEHCRTGCPRRHDCSLLPLLTGEPF